MDNQLIVDRIATFLTHAELKEFRLINKFWNTVLTRELKLRKKTQVVVNLITLSSVLKSNSERSELFCDAVKLDWGFGESFPDSAHYELQFFFLKFGKYIKTLKWIGADFFDTDHKLRNPELNSELSKEEVWKSLFSPSYRMGRQLGKFLYLIPNLEDLTLGEISIPPAPYVGRCIECKPVTDLLLGMKELIIKTITSLNFGSYVFLSISDTEILLKLNLPMKHFTFTGRGIPLTSGLPMEKLLNSWSETLQYLHIRSSPAFHLGRMPVLKTLCVEERFRLIAPFPFINQFPILESLSQNFDSYFNWDALFPYNMPAHVNLKELKIMGETTPQHRHYIQILSKCPNLKSLFMGRVNDEIARTIFENLRKLEYLSLSVDFSNETLTGISKEKLSEFSNNFNNINQSENYENRSSISILNLKKLRELIFIGSSGIGIINDTSVFHGIFYLDQLRKLVLPEGISDKSLEILALHPNLRELNIPAPQQFLQLTNNGITFLKLAKPKLILNVDFVNRYIF